MEASAGRIAISYGRGCPRVMTWTGLLAGVFVMALGVAQAQDEPPADPALADASIAERDAELASRRANPPTFMPSSSAVVRAPIPGQPSTSEISPGLRVGDLGVPLGTLHAEGTFLVRRAGAMIQAPSGEWVFVFAPTPTGSIDTPMVMVPSSELDHVLPIIAGDTTPRRLMVTGQVLVYAGRNYLVPLSIADAPAQTPDAASPSPAAPDPGTVPTTPSAEELARNPDVASLLADLEARRNVARGLSPRAPDREATRESLLTPTAINTIPEGTMLVRRRARMVREASGAWALTLDNDQGQGAASLVILPCQNLAAMERLAAGQAEEAAFEVTARVLTFQGRNYAMPLMFSLLRRSDVRTLQ